MIKEEQKAKLQESSKWGSGAGVETYNYQVWRRPPLLHPFPSRTRCSRCGSTAGARERSLRYLGVLVFVLPALPGSEVPGERSSQVLEERDHGRGHLGRAQGGDLALSGKFGCYSLSVLVFWDVLREGILLSQVAGVLITISTTVLGRAQGGDLAFSGKLRCYSLSVLLY